MTAISEARTAKIYVFPKGGRSGMSSLNKEVRPLADSALSRGTALVDIDAWYHDAAVTEVQGDRKR